MLNKVGPSTDPWGTPSLIFIHVLYSEPIFTLCFLPDK